MSKHLMWIHLLGRFCNRCSCRETRCFARRRKSCSRLGLKRGREGFNLRGQNDQRSWKMKCWTCGGILYRVWRHLTMFYHPTHPPKKIRIRSRYIFLVVLFDGFQFPFFQMCHSFLGIPGPRGDQSSRSRSAGNSLLELSNTWRNVPMQGAIPYDRRSGLW